jgi:UPF0755 protein
MRSRVAIASASMGALFFLYLLFQLYLPVTGSRESRGVEIQKGTSFREAVAVLGEYGLIKDRRFFMAMARLTGADKKLLPGRYLFPGRVSQWEVYRKLRDGEVIPWEVTIVEGEGLREIRQKLTQGGFMEAEDFDRLSSDRNFLAGLGIEAQSLEGYLFPDTYRLYKGEAPEKILETMVGRLREMFDDELKERTQAMGWDMHRVLTLASIIEREAVLDGERALISAVYHNRLKRRMRLQADPTAIYGVKPLSAGVTREDIFRETPYNTYRFRGLPPGPIASPGIKSIRAALYPADAPYLYFVSNNDGSHVFSRTHGEHLKAVRKYRRGRRG